MLYMIFITEILEEEIVDICDQFMSNSCMKQWD